MSRASRASWSSTATTRTPTTSSPSTVASGEVIGTLRLLRDGETAKVGRVAVRASFRRRGVASRMLEMAVERAAAEGCTRARLAAQTQATRVYEGAGFAVESEPFQEAGIEHVWMGRELAGQASP